MRTARAGGPEWHRTKGKHTLPGDIADAFVVLWRVSFACDQLRASRSPYRVCYRRLPSAPRRQSNSCNLRHTYYIAFCVNKHPDPVATQVVVDVAVGWHHENLVEFRSLRSDGGDGRVAIRALQFGPRDLDSCLRHTEKRVRGTLAASAGLPRRASCVRACLLPRALLLQCTRLRLRGARFSEPTGTKEML